MTTTSSRKIFYALSLLSITLISGCSTSTIKDYVSIDSRATIKTDPSGARVVVDDKEVGTTPMEFEAENIFQPHWEGTSYMVKSKLEIKKPGCTTFTRIVKDPIPKEISVKLQCQEHYVEPKPQLDTHENKKADTQKAVPTKTVPSRSIEDRLLQVQRLHKKGLITDSEYNDFRTKILKGI